MLGGFADGPAPRLPRQGAPLAKEDYVNPQGRRMGQFVVSVDPKGSLAFPGRCWRGGAAPPPTSSRR